MCSTNGKIFPFPSYKAFLFLVTRGTRGRVRREKESNRQTQKWHGTEKERGKQEDRKSNKQKREEKRSKEKGRKERRKILLKNAGNITLYVFFFLFSIANKNIIFHQEKNDLISTIELLCVL